jgi:L-galactose dehydrogenase
VGRYGSAPEDFDFSAARVTRSVDESLSRMGIDHIDLIHCHDIEFGNLDQIVNETVPTLHKLKQTGKVRFVGVTGLPLRALRYVIERVPVDAVLSYCRYALNDTALLDLIPTLKAKGIGVISASPLSMALLSNRGAPDWHPAPPRVKELCAQAAAHCRAKGASIEKLAVQYAVAQPDIATTVVGTAEPKNMELNIAALDERMDEQLLAEVVGILRPIHNVTWSSGRAENN